MGRHTSPDGGAFWRSVAGAALKWGVLAVVVAGAGVGIWRLRHSPAKRPPVPSPSPQESSPASESPPPIVATVIPPPPAASPSPSRPAGRLQLLDGSSKAGLAASAAERLQAAGFDIVLNQKAGKHYDRTTIYYQPGDQSEARAIADVLGAGLVQQAPTTLDHTIPVAVAVGNDYRP